MSKKWIALLLAVLMVFSLGTTAFAADSKEIVVPENLIQQMGYSAAYAVAHGVNPDNIVY